jgi:hypothetical protein
MFSTQSLNKLLVLAALAQPLLAVNNFCGFEVLGFNNQGQTAVASPTDTCDVEILIGIGSDNCTANTVFSGSLIYVDTVNGPVAVNGLSSATYPGGVGTQTETIAFPVPYSDIATGQAITASVFFFNALSGVGNFPVTWTQQASLVSTMVTVTTTLTSTNQIETSMFYI